MPDQFLCAPEPFQRQPVDRRAFGAPRWPTAERTPTQAFVSRRQPKPPRPMPLYKLDRDAILAPRLAYDCDRWRVSPGQVDRARPGADGGARWGATVSHTSAKLIAHATTAALGWIAELSKLPPSLQALEELHGPSRDWSDAGLEPILRPDEDLAYDRSSDSLPRLGSSASLRHRRNNSSFSSCSSGPRTPDLSPEFTASPLFSPAIVSASPLTTAPSSPIAAKSTSRVTFSIPEVNEDNIDEDQDRNSLGLELGLDPSSTSSSSATITAPAATRPFIDEDAQMAAAIAAEDACGIGALFGKMVGLTLALAGLDDDDDMDVQPIDAAGIRVSTHVEVTTSYEGEDVPRSSWSPVSEFTFQHRMDARRAAREAGQAAREGRHTTGSLLTAELEAVASTGEELDRAQGEWDHVLVNNFSEELLCVGVEAAVSVVAEQMPTYS